MANPPSSERSWLRENALSLVLFILFFVSLVGQSLTGHHVLNEELAEHGAPPVSLGAYFSEGHFWEATFENWESEFLQMALFVLLTVSLRQKGSSESKGFDGKEAVDEDPREHRGDPGVPWPVRRGGLVLALYERSLSIALFLVFAFAFGIHAVGGRDNVNLERKLAGQEPWSLSDYVTSSRFWFESFQNWQSEFVAVLFLIVLSIFLRQRGSPQSKPVFSPHQETGS